MTLRALFTALLFSIGFIANAQDDIDTVQVSYIVSAQANLFYNAIMNVDNVPGGAGMEPVAVDVRGVKYIKIESTEGEVSPFTDSTGTLAGADGGEYGLKTYVAGAGALSGIQHDTKVMFLCGVFMNYASGLDAAFPATNYTKEDNKPKHWPALNQTFYIGDGRMDNGKQQVFKVPNEAETLYLGFADCLEGDPSNYRDNQGSIKVTLILERKKG